MSKSLPDNPYNDGFLVNTAWLHDHLSHENVVVVDCQWDENAYLRAHIPGAMMRPWHPYVKSVATGKLSKFLPTEEEYANMLRQLGIDQHTQVVCYDEWGNHFATRLWWVMTYYGHTNVKILNGGWQAWVTDGYPISFKKSIAKTSINLPAIQELKSIKVGLDEIKLNRDNTDWQILDVRSHDEYTGKNLAGNKRGGHIKNAIHFEWKNLLSNNNEYDQVNYFLPAEKMLSHLKNAGIEQNKTLVVHCQSGVRASFIAFCLHILNFQKVRLYDGSMAEWTNEDDTPLSV